MKFSPKKIRELLEKYNATSEELSEALGFENNIYLDAFLRREGQFRNQVYATDAPRQERLRVIMDIFSTAKNFFFHFLPHKKPPPPPSPAIPSPPQPRLPAVAAAPVNSSSSNGLVCEEHVLSLRPNARGNYGLSFSAIKNIILVRQSKNFTHTDAIKNVFDNSLGVELISLDDGHMLHDSDLSVQRVTQILNIMSRDSPKSILKMKLRKSLTMP